MPNDLPPDLPRLEALRVRHALWIAQVDRRIEVLRRREAERECVEQARPTPPGPLPHTRASPQRFRLGVGQDACLDELR